MNSGFWGAFWIISIVLLVFCKRSFGQLEGVGEFISPGGTPAGSKSILDFSAIAEFISPSRTPAGSKLLLDFLLL